MVKDFAPSIDAGLGLVYRLNLLWSKADWAALDGKYEVWNNILDAIYRNLTYREKVVTETNNGNGGVLTNVDLSTKDTKVYRYLSLQIAKTKRNYNLAHTKKDKLTARSRWYHSLQKKDIWLRKFMMELKLYLKETEKSPGGALFGGFGK